MKERDKIRYVQFNQIIKELKCKNVGDFASGNEVVKQFLDKDINYKAYDFPEYNFEEDFIIKDKLDCIISSEVLEHLRNPRIFLHSISKSVIKGTKLILTTPNSSFIKYRINLLFGKTPDTFFGPSLHESIFGKDYFNNSLDKRRELDFQLHVRSYNYEELKKILEIEGFIIKKRLKQKFSGLKGFILYMLPINFQGSHTIIAEKK